MLAGSDKSHAALLDLLSPVLREAGDLALRTFRTAIRSWHKDNHSPVSEADLAVDALLRDRLSALAPDAGWLSEETEDNPARLSAKRLWVVDPIDGTRAYLKGAPDWTISVALVEEGRPIVAGILAPVTVRAYLAIAGGGATLDGEKIMASTGAGLDAARIAGPKRLLDHLSHHAPRIDPAPKVHSLALRLARVASGELDAAFAAGNSHDWDLAAADLLVHEAGGALTTIEGNILVYNQVHPVHRPLIAAGAGRHETLIELVRARRPEFT